MKPIAALMVLAALFCADVAVAAGGAEVRHRSPVRHPSPRLHKASRTTHHRPQQHATRTATLGAAAHAPAGVYRAADTDTDRSDREGWFRSEKDREAGWGVHDGATQTVVGLYQRPPQPDIPGPQTYHSPEGRGAAGLSLSFKLGQ